MNIKTSYVFLDTEVFIEANFNYSSPRLESLMTLTVTNRVEIFLTDITLREIKANIESAVQSALTTGRPHAILKNSSLPEIRHLFRRIDPKTVETELLSQLEIFLGKAKVRVLHIDPKTVSPVFDRYFRKLPPFGPGKQKNEFPDAFVVETLVAWCAAKRCSMAVVSRDKGVQAACEREGQLYKFVDLPAFLNAVSSEDETLSSFIRETIPNCEDEIFKNAEKEFGQLGFYLGDQDGDVDETQLTSIDFDDDIEIISLAHNRAVVEIPSTLTFTADLSFKDPASGIWDSEDKMLMFQETVERTVERTTDRTIGAEVSFNGLDPTSFKVLRVWFEGTQDIEVVSEYEEDYS